MPIVFLDTFELAASLRQRAGLFRSGEPRMLPIRWLKEGTEDRFVVSRDLGKWPELKALIEQIRRLGSLVGGGVELGRIWLEQLDPGVALPWAAESGDYADRYARLHLALRTNPKAMLYAGGEAAHLLPGNLTLVAHRVLGAAVNAGEWPRVHVVVEFTKAGQE